MTEDCVCDTLLKIAGVVFLVYLAVRVLGFIYDLFFKGSKSLRGTKGRWAVVTGASEGIGKEFCIQLARRGYNIALLSRSQGKLESVAAICEESKVEVKVIPVDFSKHPDSYIETLTKELSPLDVEVLVNNVGISFPYPEHYLKTDKQLDDQILNINIQSMLSMTRLLLPQMVEKKRGYVINLGSFSGDVPVPLLSTYSASKAFVEFFSETLQQEYLKDGIVVKCATPMFVATEMAKMRPSLTVPTLAKVVSGVLNKMGPGLVTFSPYWVHAIMSSVITCLPAFYRTPFLYKSNLKTQKRALEKLAKQQSGK